MELDSSKILITHESFAENIQKFKFAAQIEIFKENTFLTCHPYCRLGNSARTCPNILMLPQKLKLIEFSSPQKDLRSAALLVKKYERNQRWAVELHFSFSTT